MVELDDYVFARRYLAPFRTSLWRWDDEGQAIEWSSGQTVVFRPELECILLRLAPPGLPPMTKKAKQAVAIDWEKLGRGHRHGGTQLDVRWRRTGRKDSGGRGFPI